MEKLDKKMYNEKMETEKKSSKALHIIMWTLSLALAIGAGIGFWFIDRSMNYFTTDNARITTTLIAITPSTPGRLERWSITEGQHVSENEVLGWVESGDSMRSPVDGLVLHSRVVQDQIVSPAEPIALIADLNRMHIQANVEETDILRIRPGARVVLTIDGFGRRRFTGYVSEIGSITQAELSGNAMFFTTGGTFTRVRHLIPVKINLKDDINLAALIGTNARVRIAVRENISEPLAGPTTAPANHITVRGMVESVERRNIYSALGCMLDFTTLGCMFERVLVEVGDHVTERQTLGILDIRDLTIATNAQIVNAQTALNTAEVNLATARHDHELLRQLYDSGLIARNELQQSEFALQSATAARHGAEALLKTTRSALERHRENSVIRSPISGTITTRAAREGEIGTGLLFTVEDTQNLRIITRFREYDLGMVRQGMEVTITPDIAGGAPYRGVINRINPAAITGQDVVEFEAEILVVGESPSLRIGMTARVNVPVE